MFFEIRHTTRYRYSAPVFCEPLTVRLRPRDDHRQRLLDYELSVTPGPAGDTLLLDSDGNQAARLWFAGTTQALTLHSSAHVETLCENPFDFVLESEAQRLPIVYPGGLAQRLTPFRGTHYSTPVERAAQEVLDAVRGDSLGFLVELAQRIAGVFEKIVRPEGPPWPADQTLAERAGSCRDVAVLFNECARRVGFAARFVSGYHEGDPDEPRHLHAWSEVYLPGAGWIGFDPGSGLAVADRHVAVAASAEPAGAAPTAGTFRGYNARSEMEVTLEIECRPRPSPAATD